MSTPHKHAALMMMYAQDAAETDKPWERWEIRMSPEKPWVGLRANPVFEASWEYRRKPVMVTRTITYPEPCRDVAQLKGGTPYFLASLEDEVTELAWNNLPVERRWLAQGRIHLTRENAEAHRLALLGGGE